MGTEFCREAIDIKTLLLNAFFQPQLLITKAINAIETLIDNASAPGWTEIISLFRRNVLH